MNVCFLNHNDIFLRYKLMLGLGGKELSSSKSYLIGYLFKHDIVIIISGVSTFLCLAPGGNWDPQGPDLSNCSSLWVNHITQKVTVHLDLINVC